MSLNCGVLSDNKYLEISHFLSENEVDVLCIQESGKGSNDAPPIPGYTAYQIPGCPGRNNKLYRGGLITYFRESMNVDDLGSCTVSQNTVLEPLETHAFKIYLNGNHTLNLINLYSRHPVMSDLNKLKDLCTGNFLIVGDMNAHSVGWGSPVTNSQGKLYWEWVEEIEGVILNDGTITRIDPIRGTGSVLDLAITSAGIASKTKLAVGDDNFGSDHFPIYVEYEHTKGKVEVAQEFLNFKKADWDLFRDKCGRVTLNDVWAEDIDTFNGNIISYIMDRAKESIPVSKVRENKRPSCPWWNHACELSVRARKKCLSKLKRNPTPTNLEHYRATQREVSHTVLQAKTDCWDQFCESMIVKANNGKFVSTKPFWNKIRKINGNQFKAVPLLKVGNIAAADSLGKANLLAKHYAAVTQDSNIAVETLEHQK